MSRIGRKPVMIPTGTTITITERVVTAKGPKGELTLRVNPRLDVAQENDHLLVSLATTDKSARALQGLTARLLANLVTGVTEGFTRVLELHGVGYRAAVQGSTLVLNVGFSHTVEITAPAGVDFAVQKNTITISGTSKQQVGQVAAEIRSVRKPEPYKGKGIRYSDEIVRRKAGKAAKAAGAAA